MPQATTLFAGKAALRQGIFYAVFFTGTGASLPFMPVWLKAHAMSPAQIGVILAVPLLLRAVTGPWSGLWADRFALFRTPLAVLTAAGAVLYGLMFLAGLLPSLRFAIYLALFTIGFTCVTSASPLIDAMTMILARRKDFAYALPRAVGSTFFIFANVALGFVLLRTTSDAILIWMIAAAAASAVTAVLVLPPDKRFEAPRPEVQSSTRDDIDRLKVLLRNPGFLWLVAATGCLQAAHAFYYAFSTIIWKSQGLSSATCGYLWAVAVTGEVVFMSLGESFRRRIGPWRLLILSGVLSVVRWAALSLSPPLWLLWPVQVLHAFSFAATYLAGLELVRRLAPKGCEGLAQTVSAAYGSGVMLGIGTVASGAIYEGMGAFGYAVSAVIAAVGLAAAVRLYAGRERFLSPTVPASADAGSSR